MTITRSIPLCVLVCALFLASCANTVRGVSRDLNETANAVDDALN